jgi:hypothetical protein
VVEGALNSLRADEVIIVYIFLFFLYPLLGSNSHANSSPTLAHELLPRLWHDCLRLGLVGDTKNLGRRICSVQLGLSHLLDLHKLLLLRVSLDLSLSLCLGGFRLARARLRWLRFYYWAFSDKHGIINGPVPFGLATPGSELALISVVYSYMVDLLLISLVLRVNKQLVVSVQFRADIVLH